VINLNTFEAIWGFSEDITTSAKKTKEEIVAHISQPIGIPLHKYEGKLAIDDKGISLTGETPSDQKMAVYVPFKAISDLFLGWDDLLRRWRDSRALIKPLRITFENEERKTLYIFVRKVGAKIFGGENKELYTQLKTSIESAKKA